MRVSCTANVDAHCVDPGEGCTLRMVRIAPRKAFGCSGVDDPEAALATQGLDPAEVIINDKNGQPLCVLRSERDEE